MARIGMFTLITTLLLVAGASRAPGQECESLRNARSADLVSFLNGVVPDRNNGECVTWAIKRLGTQQFEPAIPVLVMLLDFRRPPNEQEKRGVYLHPPDIWESYPATVALDLIGKKALPAILGVVKADSTSAVWRENAVSVWMEIYRQSDEQPKGVALLKQEESKTGDDGIRRKLKWAADRAVSYCSPPDVAACRRAAATGAP